MTGKQNTVLLLLMVLLGLEVYKQSIVRDYVTRLISGVQQNVQPGATYQPLNVDFKSMVYWIIAALALIALAGPLPGLAIGLLLILILLVILSDVELFTKLLQRPKASS